MSSYTSYAGGGHDLGQFTATYEYTAASLAVDRAFFIANVSCTVVSIILRVDIAGTDVGAVTCQIRKAPSGTAIASGTLLHSGTGNLKGTAATNQVLTLSTTASDLTIPIGTCVGFDLTGVSTAAVGCVTVAFQGAA
jgi:hypothetical protein